MLAGGPSLLLVCQPVEPPGAARFCGFLAMVRALGIATPSSEESLSVQLGAGMAEHKISAKAPPRLKNFVATLSLVCAPSSVAGAAPSSVAGAAFLREQDASYDQALAEMCSKGCLGPSGSYTKSLLRRKRLAMSLRHSPAEAVLKFWETATVATLKDIVPDVKSSLSAFPESAKATDVSGFFGFDSAMGPLSMSMHACLWRPVAKLLQERRRVDYRPPHLFSDFQMFPF